MKKWFAKDSISRKATVATGIGGIFIAAAYISAQHIMYVATHYGQTLAEAIALPVILDIFGLFAAYKLRTPGITDTARIRARIGLYFSILSSLAFNYKAAMLRADGLSGEDLFWSIFISMLPAVVVALTAEMLTHTHKKSTPTRKPAPEAPTAKITAKGTIPAQRRSGSRQKAPEKASTKAAA